MRSVTSPSQNVTTVWMAPLAGVMAYPGLLFLFAGAVATYRETGGSLVRITWSVALMAAAIGIPVMAARGLDKIRDSTDPKAPAVRMVLHFVFAVFPLFGLNFALTRLFGIWNWHIQIWLITFATIGAILYAYRPGQETERPGVPVKPWLRTFHGAIAMLLLLGYLIPHLINHGTALWSIELNTKVMEFFRYWYRSALVEPVLIAMLAAMVMTGLHMTIRYSRECGDRFRVLQTATGTYLAVFICSHLTAVLSARNAGVETDWYFAIGPTGHILDTAAFLIPYYMAGVFFLLAHVSLGLRQILLAHSSDEHTANRTFFALTGGATLVTVLITAAMFGVHLGE